MMSRLFRIRCHLRNNYVCSSERSEGRTTERKSARGVSFVDGSSWIFVASHSAVWVRFGREKKHSLKFHQKDHIIVYLNNEAIFIANLGGGFKDFVIFRPRNLGEIDPI